MKKDKEILVNICVRMSQADFEDGAMYVVKRYPRNPMGTAVELQVVKATKVRK